MPVVLLVGAVPLWLVAVGTTDAADVGAYGLTHALGAPFIVAVVAVCLAFAVELLGRSRPPVLAAGIVSITVMLRASAPLLLANVEYPWTYKHFGVVELIRQTGRIVDPADIYRLWPAFFATMAQLSDVTGVASIDYATWSSLLFSLIDALLLAAAVRVAIDATGWSGRSYAQTTRSEAIGHAGVRDNRIVFLTVFLFQACLWVDTNYFSPQAYAFALFLGFVVILRGWLYHGPDGTRRGLRRLWRRPATTERSASRLWPTVAAVGVFFVITATHQLSPYIILVGVAALGVLGRVRPRIIVLLLGAVAFGYLAPRLGDVLSDYGLLSGFNLFRNASGNAPTWGSAAQRFSALLARGLALTIWATALLTLWRRRRQPSMGTVGILAFSPFVILGAQSYGGEAIYRVFLFSLPWCALLIAVWLVDGSFSRRRRLATAGIALMLSAFSMAAHQGLQGQFAVHAVASTDIAAARYFYSHAPAGSSLLLGAQNFPARLTGGYGRFNVGVPLEPAITDEDQLRDAALGERWLPRVEAWARDHAGTQTYLVVSRQMAVDAQFFGDLPTGALAALDDALRASPRWDVFYQAPGVTIFRQRASG